eukprot:gene1417-4514_t
MTFWDDTYAALVDKTITADNMWHLFDPFESNLWWAYNVG